MSERNIMLSYIVLFMPMFLATILVIYAYTSSMMVPAAGISVLKIH